MFMEPKSVALTIRDQIRFGAVKGARNGQHAMMCWAFSTPQFGKVEELPGLIFKVNGRKHTGKVAVVLEPRDTYKIFLANSRGKDKAWREVRDDVYCEELAQILDNLIET